MPSLGDVHLGGDHTIEDDSADFVLADRFDGDADAAGVFVFGWFDRTNRRVTNETGQFDGAGFGIRDRRFKTDDATDRDDIARLVVNTNRRCVSQMRSWSTATGQSIAMRRIGCSQQSVVFDRRDVETVTRSNTSGQVTSVPVRRSCLQGKPARRKPPRAFARLDRPRPLRRA